MVVARLEGVDLETVLGAAEDEVGVAAGPPGAGAGAWWRDGDVGGAVVEALEGAGELAGGNLAGLLALVGVPPADTETGLGGVAAVEIVGVLLRRELHVHPRRAILLPRRRIWFWYWWWRKGFRVWWGGLEGG